MKRQVWAFFARLGRELVQKSPKNPEIEEIVVGKTLTLDLFKQELLPLGYDFEVYINNFDRILRFRRIAPKEDRISGEYW
jgi:hypothetical protein